MDNQTTRVEESNGNRATLHLAFELGRKEWKLGFAVEAAQKPRLRTMPAGDIRRLREEIERAQQRFGVVGGRVVSCYEAGREGFWLHRRLESLGIANQVVDSSSIEVNRRSRRAKTDGLDVQKLLVLLMRYESGEKKVWSVVRVPSVEQEDGRQLSRELEVLKGERTSHRNRIQGLLASQGVRVELTGDVLERLEKSVLWDGRGLPAGLKERLKREVERLEKVQEQIRFLERERKKAVAAATAAEPSLWMVKQLVSLRGVGVTSAWLFVHEFFGWREFRNRRQVGALAGLVPMPYQSGDTDRDQGISKSGNRRLRSMIIEIAWAWLRLQPQSRLSLWFKERYGSGSRRSRRIGIVALARKLLVELWRYLQTGALPDGAVLKAA